MEDRDIVDEILDNFDFDKVVKVMEYLEWTWASTGGELVYVSDARKFARHLLTEALSKVKVNTNSEFNIESGGFRAEAETFLDDDKKYARLSFELESHENY